ncbi:MAG: glycosyl hydrolase 2 galactose-binding domain-containing protein, partial [Acidimicrobiales bacterium]
MELGGTWRAAPADEALRRSFAASGYDDGGWEQLMVPGHWRSTPAFAELDGPVLYRRRFDAPAPGPGRRSWLTLDGVFYDGDVWLDGSYVGATEGYFFPHTFEVTDALATRGEHVLAVEVACGSPADRRAKRNLTGVFQHWDCFDPAWNPGGIWRPVSLSETGPVRLSRLRVLCAEATAERATLEIRAVLEADAAGDALLRVGVSGPSGASSLTRHALAAGTNRIRLRVPVDQPALWWPHALGSQPLHDVEVEVLVPRHPTAVGDRRPRRSRDDEITAGDLDDHEPSDARRLRTGIRQVRMKNFILTVNGERLFVKGSNQGPTRMALG